MKKKIGLYFGSFNPIHIGHLAIANYIVEYTDLNQIWFVITPHNPLKKKETLLDDKQRFYMVNLAVEDEPRFKASAVEFSLPKPSYTINTLTYLKEKYPKNDFALIMGGDNLENIHKWKNYLEILENYPIFVYPRPKKNPLIQKKGAIHLVNAPLMEISASFIRNAIKSGKDIRYFLPEKVFQYLDEMNLYK